MRNIIRFLYAAIPFLISACAGNQNAGIIEEGDTLHLSYAKNLAIIKYKGYTKVELADPWHKGRTLHTYILTNGNEEEGLPSNSAESTVIQLPLSRCVVSTSVHSELSNKLGKGNAVAGVFDSQYINSQYIKERIKNGKIADCGNSMSPNIEMIATLSPDVIFLSPMQNAGGYGKLETLGIPIIELADYMEPTAMGRAEWIKFYGILFGAEKKANAIFTHTEKEYKRLKALATKSHNKPLVLMDKAENGVWYVPGGRSTISQMIYDANATYAYSSDKSAGSLQKAPESVIDDNSKATVWLMRYYKPGNQPMTMKELLAEHSGYGFIQAFQAGNVYGCNTATSTFFEDVPFEPHLLLNDFIIAIHPDLANGKTAYFNKLK